MEQSESHKITEVLKQAETILTSVITPVEVERAFIQGEKAGTLNAAQRNEMRGMLARASTDWNLMDLLSEVRTRAREPFPVEPVRTLDAIHLATALEWSKIYFDLQIFSHDKRILANAKPLGIPSVTLKD